MYPAVLVFGQALAAKLYTAVHLAVQLKLKFQNKIAIGFLGGQKRIGLAKNGGTHNFAITRFKFGFAIQWLPAIKVFAVKEWGEPGRLRIRTQYEAS